MAYPYSSYDELVDKGYEEVDLALMAAQMPPKDEMTDREKSILRLGVLSGINGVLADIVGNQE